MGVARPPSLRLATWLFVSLIAVAAAGCDRKPRLVPAGADSTGAADSSTVRLRGVQTMWEGAASSEAAEQTARVVWERIAASPPTEWKERGDLLLDSLNIGYESAAGDCGLLVNFFSRSDPGAGSWPYLFTCASPRLAYQGVEGRNLRLTSMATRGIATEGRMVEGAPGVAALFARRAGAGQQPVLMTWKANEKTRRWELSQTLGPDSLGGTGTADFETPADTTIELQARTYRTPSSFEECATCPHFYKIHRFRWGARDFVRAAPDSLVPSPYATFVMFIQALNTDDRDRAMRCVADGRVFDQARELDWGRPRGIWRVAPAANETPQHVVFFRGDQEAYRVSFVQDRGDWLISAFETTTRTLE